MEEKNFNKIFSTNLKFFMNKFNMSQNELANILGVSPTSVNNWYNGYKVPRMDKVDKICEVFHINRSDLIQEHEEEPQGYYFDDEAAQMAQELFERKELRVLFDASRNVSKEDIEDVAALLEKLKQR